MSRMRATRHRVLLLGAGGRLGGAIRHQLASPAGQPLSLHAPSRDALALDPARPEQAVDRWFESWQPDTVVNCIAMSDVDRCEREPLVAWQLNAALPAALAGAARRTGARLIHFSTDFVFDGELRRPYRESDPARPLSVYGSSKLDGEQAIADRACAHWVFRISWLYGAPTGNLAAALLDPSSAGCVIRLADNRFGVPNPVQLVAAEVVDAIAREAIAVARPALPSSGLYHLACHGVTTWLAFGMAFLREAVRAGRLAAERLPQIEALDEAALERPARRPQWSALDPGHYERSFGRRMPDWESAIPSVFRGDNRNRGDR